MGVLGDLVDDVFEVPGKVLRGILGIPADVVKAAREAGCKTTDEILEFFHNLEE